MASHQNIVLYSCIINKRDAPKPIEVNAEFSHVLFTDDVKIEAPGWEKRPLTWIISDPVRTARYYKHHPFDLFPDATYTIWLDMTHWAYQDLTSLLTHDFSLHRHQERQTIKTEAEKCASLNFDDPDLLNTQVAYYSHEGFLDNKGLYSTSCLIRKNTYQNHLLSEMWWSEICKWSKRDQISLPFCLWRLGIEPGIIPGVDRGGFSPYFKMISHHKKNIC